MNIYLHELKSYGKSTVIWAISLALVSFAFLSLFPAFYDNASTVRDVIKSMPEPIRKSFGISLENITTLLGFYSWIFSFIVIFGAIQAMNLSVSIISKEVKDKTADFLLTKPVSRKQIITAKLLTALTTILITNLVYTLLSLSMALAVKKGVFSVKTFLLITMSMLLIQLMFMAMGVLISVIIPKIKSSISISLGLVFGFFIISALSSSLDIKEMSYITPFKYFDTQYILSNSAYDAVYGVIALLFVVAAVIASYYVYIKKDIHAV